MLDFSSLYCISGFRMDKIFLQSPYLDSQLTQCNGQTSQFEKCTVYGMRSGLWLYRTVGLSL